MDTEKNGEPHTRDEVDEKPEENDPQEKLSDLEETLANVYDEMAATEKFAKEI